MNFNFKLEGINVSIPENDVTPEINFELKGLAYEVTDLSMSEYAQVVKMLTSEVIGHIKDINQAQETQAERAFQRDLERHEMFMKEHSVKEDEQKIRERADKVLSDLEKKLSSRVEKMESHLKKGGSLSSQKQQEFDKNFDNVDLRI